ncbi:MAG: hypothetical protein CMK06_08965 [Ponticaulis sp.]|nr:hypothetical protein [Ponticaulis sp.]
MQSASGGVMQDQKVYGVLSGKQLPVEPSLPSQANAVRKTLSDCAQLFQTCQTEVTCPEIGTWHITMSRPELSLRLALLIRARLYAEFGLVARIAIGIGPQNGASKSHLASGLSDRALSHMTSYFDLTGALPLQTGPLREWMRTLLHLCSGLAKGWTKRQAEILAQALIMPTATHQQISETLSPPVRKQTVTDSLRGANWRVLQEALVLFEQTDWQKLITANC